MKCRTGSKLKRGWIARLAPITGLAALVWFLVRVVPKPSRATYPCQRVAAPLASAFVAYVLGLAGAVVAFRKAKERLRYSRYVVAGLFAVVGMVAAGWSVMHLPVDFAWGNFTPADAPNSPVGVAKGIYPGRVSWVHDPDATDWDGSASYWWDDSHTDQAVVDAMMSDALRWLTEADSDSDAWDRLFRHFNQTHGKGDVGYQSGETIAVKVNLNNTWSYTDADNQIDASPQMVRALLRQLVNQAGVSEASITVYDAIRWIPDRIYDRCHPEFPNVRFEDRDGLNGRVQTFWLDEVIDYSGGTMSWNARRLPQSVVSADYLVNMAILKRHAWNAPVTLIGKSHFGSIADPGALHPYIDPNGQLGYDPEVDLMGHEHLGHKTMLFLLDGLYGGRDVLSIGAQWILAPFNNDWPSSLFVSQDQVALDSVAIDFLREEMFYELPPNTDNYLHEASQADAPPSATFYDPEGDGTRLDSLGAHEHWNDATNKQYTRNLGTGEGIELISVNPGSNGLPTVSATSPKEGQTFPPGSDITIQATASDADGSIAKVEFFEAGAGKLGEDTTVPYEHIWMDVPAGDYSVKTRAVDDDGATKWSEAVGFSVSTPGDYDGDGDVDLDDYAIFAGCLGGSEVTTPPGGCAQDDFENADLDGDEDVDLNDFAAFQLAFTG